MKKQKSYIKYEDVIDQQNSLLNLEIKPFKNDSKTPYLQSRKITRNSLPILRSPLQSQIRDRIEIKEPDNYLRIQYDHLKERYDKQEIVNQGLMAEIATLKHERSCLKQQIEELKINLQRYQSDDETAFQRAKQQATQHDNIVREMQQKINALIAQNKLVEQKQLSIPNVAFLSEFQSLCLDLKSQLECKFCGKELKDPVTLIPCAHSYCKGCRKGYNSNCYLCGKDEKVEAVYLNQFMIEMMALYKRNIRLVELMKNNL